MAKQRKKRTKRYTGEDARSSGVAGQSKPVIHRSEAVLRNPLNQWVHERRRLLRVVAVVVAIICFVALVTYGLVLTVNR